MIPIPVCLRPDLSWFNWWVSFAPEFHCGYFGESSCLYCLSFNFDIYVSKIIHANRNSKYLRKQSRSEGEGCSTANQLKPPSNVIADRPKAALFVSVPWWF